MVKLRPGTQNAYGAALKHLRDYFGKQRMTHITPTDVARYVSKKQSEPRETRRTLIRAFTLASSKREARPSRKHGNIPL